MSTLQNAMFLVFKQKSNVHMLFTRYYLHYTRKEVVFFSVIFWRLCPSSLLLLTAIDCPANSHFEACGAACASSCAEKDAASTCKLPCVEGCQCDKGFVLSVDKCVPETSCGCTHEGRYYPPGKTFWTDNTCSKKCTCNSGNLQCTDTKCKSSEVCSLRNGVRDCYPLSYATCWGSGDPHYRSFDGKRFDFQGTCTYYLSKLVNTEDPTLKPFEVQVQNENRGRNKAVAYTKTVLIKVYGHTIVLSSDNPGRVLVSSIMQNSHTCYTHRTWL